MIFESTVSIYCWTSANMFAYFMSCIVHASTCCALQRRHNELDGVSNHQRLDCLLNRLFRNRSKKTSKLCVTSLFEENPPVIPSQRTSKPDFFHFMTSSCNVVTWYSRYGIDLDLPEYSGVRTRSVLNCCSNVLICDYTFSQSGTRHEPTLPVSGECDKKWHHYNDVVKSTIASQITSLTIVYSTVYSGAGQRNHQSSALLAFVRGIHRWPMNSPHKWPITRKMFPFDDVIMMEHYYSQKGNQPSTKKPTLCWTVHLSNMLFNAVTYYEFFILSSYHIVVRVKSGWWLPMVWWIFGPRLRHDELGRSVHIGSDPA